MKYKQSIVMIQKEWRGWYFIPIIHYSDFVGQILPKVENDNKLKYEFTAGPFTTLLAKAWNNQCKEYYLVIEEINRGNAPAIFGEIFPALG